ELRHAGGASRALVADNHHVTVSKRLGVMLQCVDQLQHAVENASSAGEHAVLQAAFDPGDLEYRSSVGCNVSVEEPKAAGALEGFVYRVDNIPVWGWRV